jgi:hypothetical protein
MFIPLLITEFTNQPLWRQKSMKAWLYLGLPEAMKKTITMFANECHESLKHLAEKSGDPTIASLRIDDGSLDRRYDELKRKYKDVTFPGDVWDAFDQIDRRKRGYENTVGNRDFLKNELLPVLKELESGIAPTRMHQSVVEEGIRDSASTFYWFILGRDWFPVTLMPENKESTYVVIKDFLGTLRDRVAAVTGCERVLEPEGRGG